ncbi:MAG: response regulator [Acidobacteria bacterium]|nr:response regulator [Acidobacteriota bacterium]
MAIFGLGKDKKTQGPGELVLAYIEDAQRVRAPFTLVEARGRECPAHLLSLDPGTGQATFQLQGSLMSEKGARITLVFVLDGLRVGGEATLLALRPGQADLSLPEELALTERRRRPRARLHLKEGTTLTALSGLFEGAGLTGIAENISEQGVRVRLERAMEIKTEKKLALHANLVQPGHSFDLVKLSKLPRIPGSWECEGKAIYLENAGGALYLGLHISRFPSEMLPSLRSLISGRVSPPPATLPPKVRRSLEVREEAPPASSAPAAPAALAVPASPAVPQAPAAAAPPPAPAVPPPTEMAAPRAEAGRNPASETPAPVPKPSAASARNPALLRLKKRSRSVILAIPPGNGHQVPVVDHLTEEGYGRVIVANHLSELVPALEGEFSSQGCLLVDGGVAELGGMELVEALRRLQGELPPVILAQEEISTALVLAARRAGVTQLMVKPYALDESFSAIVEQALGLSVPG